MEKNKVVKDVFGKLAKYNKNNRENDVQLIDSKSFLMIFVSPADAMTRHQSTTQLSQRETRWAFPEQKSIKLRGAGF